MPLINLISDTVTKPTQQMLQAMMKAEVGDDVFKEDVTVSRLENKLAAMFGHESALFCPSGTMSNQLAIKCHTQPMDEVICEKNSYIYQYENGGWAIHSGVSIHLIDGIDGILDASQIKSAVKPLYDWLPQSKLVVIENSANKAGGNYYTLEQLKTISQTTRSHNLNIHLDGARLFNVIVETGDPTESIGPLFDSISICLSKGLGAPVGSVLIGSKPFIDKARRWRKVFGGGMRQAGYLAAAGIFALDHHVERLKLDNDRAIKLGEALKMCDYVDKVRPVKTNIVIFDLKHDYTAEHMLHYLSLQHIKASAFGDRTVRFVTHMDVSEQMIDDCIKALKAFK